MLTLLTLLTDNQIKDSIKHHKITFLILYLNLITDKLNHLSLHIDN